MDNDRSHPNIILPEIEWPFWQPTADEVFHRIGGTVVRNSIVDHELAFHYIRRHDTSQSEQTSYQVGDCVLYMENIDPPNGIIRNYEKRDDFGYCQCALVNENTGQLQRLSSRVGSTFITKHTPYHTTHGVRTNNHGDVMASFDNTGIYRHIFLRRQNFIGTASGWTFKLSVYNFDQTTSPDGFINAFYDTVPASISIHIGEVKKVTALTTFKENATDVVLDFTKDEVVTPSDIIVLMNASCLS